MFWVFDFTMVGVFIWLVSLEVRFRDGNLVLVDFRVRFFFFYILYGGGRKVGLFGFFRLEFGDLGFLGYFVD